MLKSALQIGKSSLPLQKKTFCVSTTFLWDNFLAILFDAVLQMVQGRTVLFPGTHLPIFLESPLTVLTSQTEEAHGAIPGDSSILDLLEVRKSWKLQGRKTGPSHIAFHAKKKDVSLESNKYVPQIYFEGCGSLWMIIRHLSVFCCPISNGAMKEPR